MMDISILIQQVKSVSFFFMVAQSMWQTRRTWSCGKLAKGLFSLLWCVNAHILWKIRKKDRRYTRKLFEQKISYFLLIRVVKEKITSSITSPSEDMSIVRLSSVTFSHRPKCIRGEGTVKELIIDRSFSNNTGFTINRRHKTATEISPYYFYLNCIKIPNTKIGCWKLWIVKTTQNECLFSTRLKSASTWFCRVLALLKFCCHRTNGLQGRKVASLETLALGQTSLSLLQASDQVPGAGRLRLVSSGEVRNYKSVKQRTLSLTKQPPRGWSSNISRRGGKKYYEESGIEQRVARAKKSELFK